MRERLVRGQGYSIAVPPTWKVARTVRGVEARSGDALLSVTSFRLRRAYTAAHFPAVSRELDGVAARLAAAEHAKLTRKQTVTLAGGRARAYTIGAGGRLERIGFVLRGRSEYQLFCRYAPRSPAEAACSSLFKSFRLT